MAVDIEFLPRILAAPPSPPGIHSLAQQWPKKLKYTTYMYNFSLSLNWISTFAFWLRRNCPILASMTSESASSLAPLHPRVSQPWVIHHSKHSSGISVWRPVGHVELGHSPASSANLMIKTSSLPLIWRKGVLDLNCLRHPSEWRRWNAMKSLFWQILHPESLLPSFSASP